MLFNHQMILHWAMICATALPGMMQLINMAGVVASPTCATLTPWLAIPATMDVSSNGPDSLESLPICANRVMSSQCLTNCMNMYNLCTNSVWGA